MRIINSDGTEAEMCGNGIRCMARFIQDYIEPDSSTEKNSYRIWTGAGVIIPEMLHDGQIKVDMGCPILQPSLIPTLLPATTEEKGVACSVNAPLQILGNTYLATAVSMGNPHVVIFVNNMDDMDIDDMDDTEIGPGVGHMDAGDTPMPLPLPLHCMKPLPFTEVAPHVENHMTRAGAGAGTTGTAAPTFPEKVNAEFVQIVSVAGQSTQLDPGTFRSNHVRMRVWERGCGETHACGTGACAVVVAGILRGSLKYDVSTRVTLPGGDLQIFWDRDGSNKVFMTGSAQAVFTGTFLYRTRL